MTRLQFTRRAGWSFLGVIAFLFLLVVVSPAAQSFVIGYFSRIYFGGGGVGTSTGPQIRWGTAAPSGVCTPGTLYLQNATPTTQGASGYFCLATSSWVQIARADQVGNDFYAAATTFGAKCDGSTDDAVAIQGAIHAAFLFGKAGHVVLPAGNCTFETPLEYGPVTNPWQVSPSDPLFHSDVGLQFTAPRAATINYTAASSTITFVAGVITAADIGNFVFYGTADAEYTAVGVTRITRPTYGCTVTVLLTATSATCVAPILEVIANVPLAATTGPHASYITDDHSVTIDDSVFNATPATFSPSHVGKTLVFALPIIRAPLDFDNLPRPGSHVILEPVPAPCAGGDPALWDWQCYSGIFIKTQYYTAVITSVTDPTHAKMQISGLSPGSNWVGNFPDSPVHGGINAECGGSDPNCASYPAHEWGHLVPAAESLTASNPHITHTVDTTISSAYNQATASHTYLGVIYPYELPADTTQRYMSMRGASSAGTLLTFTGDCSDPKWVNACAALIVSKNKYFTFEDFSVVNGSGSDPDDTTQWGIYFGGLPGVGTQALGFQVKRVGVGGFGVCVQLGDNLGGEVSDADFDLLSVSNCGIGVRIGPGSFNTLDLKFHDLQGGLNKIGLLNASGNVFIDKGSFSFNDIDFIAAGFGPFSVGNMRSEGPGIFLVGGEAGTRVFNNNLAEPSGTRQITGDVTATPADTHTVAGVSVSNVPVGFPPNSFYPITFGSGDITGADLRKTVVIPGLGASGADVIAQIWSADTLTTGTVFSPVAGAIVSAGVVTVTIYDTNLADITFPVDSITTGDIGSSLALPDSTALGTKAVRCAVTSIISTTTGQCGFFLGGQGAGPLITGTSTDPKLFVHDVIYWNSNTAAGATVENNLFPTGRIFLDLGQMNRQHMTLLDNALLSFNHTPVSFATAGPSGTGKYYALNLSLTNPDLTTLPVPDSGTIISTGVVLPWTLVNIVSQSYHGAISITSRGNSGQFYGGPTPWQIADGDIANLTSTDSRLSSLEYGYNSFDTPLNPFVLQPPDAPVGARHRISGLKLLSESHFVAGNNLRILCTFATSDTATCPFTRAETIEVRNGIASPTFFDALTQTWGMNVTSGHFKQGDVGKVLTFPTCCGDGNGQNFWGTIVEITSATVIKVQSIAGGYTFPTGATTGSATVGQDEPDAKWLPALWGCNANETFWIDSFTAAQIVLKSSNATSTAGCLVGVIR